MPHYLKNYLLASIMLIAGFAGVFGLSNFLENSRPPTPESYIDEELTLQGEKLKGYALGMEGLLADWYWMQSLQYIGDKVANSKEQVINIENLRPLDPKLLYPYLDNSTTLDPEFLAPYSYGAIVLPAIDPEQAIKITNKGIKNNPDNWRLYQHLGYIYWRMKDFDKASETYEKGSKIEGSPIFMKQMVAKMKTSGGSLETSRLLYENMYNESTDPQIKESAALRILQIESIYERNAIQKVLDTYENDECPTNWQQVIPKLANLKLENGKSLRFDRSSKIPLDPTNVPYKLFKENGDCRVIIDSEISKIPLD